jgi:hypothetical protein
MLESIFPWQWLHRWVEPGARSRIAHEFQWRQQKGLPLLSLSGIFYDSAADHGHPFHLRPKDDRPYLSLLPFSSGN